MTLCRTPDQVYQGESYFLSSLHNYLLDGHRARTVGAAADLCDCPPRKEPYKTVRGLREHLMIKHGLSQAEAEAKAQGVFARLQAGNRYRARHESQSFSPAREYNIEDWNYQYGESTIDGVVADHVALPNWDRRA